MARTAEAIAVDEAMTRGTLDELMLLEYQQILTALADDRAIQRPYFQPVISEKGNPRSRSMPTREYTPTRSRA